MFRTDIAAMFPPCTHQTKKETSDPRPLLLIDIQTPISIRASMISSFSCISAGVTSQRTILASRDALAWQ